MQLKYGTNNVANKVETLPSSIINNDYDPVLSSFKNQNILQIHGV